MKRDTAQTHFALKSWIVLGTHVGHTVKLKSFFDGCFYSLHLIHIILKCKMLNVLLIQYILFIVVLLQYVFFTVYNNAVDTMTFHCIVQQS